MAAGLASGAAAPAYAGLIGPVGPIQANGFPLSYSDGSITLGQCLFGPQCLAILPTPAAAPAYPGNFSPEHFYFAASVVPTGTLVFYEAALEGGYVPGTVTPGQEMGFTRIRIELNNIVPGATYRVQHPYGDLTATEGGPLDKRGRTDQLGFTVDAGCLGPCITAADFALAKTDFIGNSANPTAHFLTQNNPVAGSIGDLLVAGPVGGAPNVDALGQSLNKIIVTGPNAGGQGVNTLTVDQFNVQGVLVGPAVAPSAPLVPAVTTGPVPVVNWQTPANGGSAITSYSVQAVDPVTGALVGPPQPAVPPVAGTSANSLAVTGLALGTKVAFQVTATNAAGLTSLVSVRSATVIPGTQNQRYVGRVYYDLFNRAPDPSGLASWGTKLDAFTPRVAVANAITNSTEYRSTLITGSYLKYLGRTPDQAGMNTWLAAMNRGFTVSRIEGGFIASPEYFVKAGNTPALWVQKLYSDVLGRAAAPSEVSFWTTRLGAGATRNSVAMGFLLSTERLTTVVNGYYQKFLGRDIDPSGLATWVRKLQAGEKNETIIGGIIASPEYFGKS